MPKALKALLLVVGIGVLSFIIYKEVRWILYGRDEARQRIADEWYEGQALAFTKSLQEKGEQDFGPYVVKAAHQEGAFFTDVTIEKKQGEKTVQEIKAKRLRFLISSADTCKVALWDVTVTDHGDGDTSTKTYKSADFFFYQPRAAAGFYNLVE